MKRLPTLPKKLATLFGVIPVKVLSKEQSDKDNALGWFDEAERSIAVAEHLARDTQWQTFWHEVVEVAVFDSGVLQMLNEKQKEAMCDAVGAQLTAMMRSGQLKVSRTWEKAAQ